MQLFLKIIMEKGQSCFYRGGSTVSSSFQIKLKVMHCSNTKYVLRM